jgi:hypothetical protein
MRKILTFRHLPLAPSIGDDTRGAIIGSLLIAVKVVGLFYVAVAALSSIYFSRATHLDFIDYYFFIVSGFIFI